MNELRAYNLTVGATYKALVLNAAGQYWTGSGFTAAGGVTWATTGQAMTADGATGIDYVGNFPAGVPAGRYTVKVVRQAGANLALSDVQAGAAAVGVIDWDGSAEVAGLADVRYVNGQAANPQPNPDIIATLTTAGGSTTSAVVVASPYDGSKQVDYVDNWLFWRGKVARITSYDDAGGGASVFEVTPPYDLTPGTGQTVVVLLNTETAAGANPRTGSGDVAINHNGGAGVLVNGVASAPDCLQIEDPDGDAIDDAEIVAYLKSDYDAGNTGVDNRRATTRTRDDGRWVEPIMLSPGTYTLVVNAERFEADEITLTVT